VKLNDRGRHAGRLAQLGQPLDFSRSGDGPRSAEVGGEALQGVSGPLNARLIVVFVRGVERLQVLRSVCAQEIDHLLKQVVVVPHATQRTGVIVNRQHIRSGGAPYRRATAPAMRMKREPNPCFAL